jgi:hypothetical protein
MGPKAHCWSGEREQIQDLDSRRVRRGAQRTARRWPDASNNRSTAWPHNATCDGL